MHEIDLVYPSQIYVDIEMTSLEDAYVRIARAEECLHGNNHMNNIDRDDLQNDEGFKRYLSTTGSSTFTL